MIPVFAEILPVMNSSSHFFICLLMSTQYRETVISIFERHGAERKKIIIVQECKSTRSH